MPMALPAPRSPLENMRRDSRASSVPGPTVRRRPISSPANGAGRNNLSVNSQIAPAAVYRVVLLRFKLTGAGTEVWRENVTQAHDHGLFLDRSRRIRGR